MQINISNVSKSYGSQKALDAINLSIPTGEIVGLLGPNGAGKSTLMKSITGAISFDEGEIYVGETNVLTSPLKAKRSIGFLPENNPLYHEMYIQEYLEYVRSLHKADKASVKEIIAQVGLLPEIHKKIGQLSKGYKQRVGLAQALIGNKKILILDEPTNGLDPNQILEIRQLIRELAKTRTVIISTHIMQEVEALCARVVLLNKGKIISDTNMEDFKGNYQNLEEAFKSLTQNQSV